MISDPKAPTGLEITNPQTGTSLTLAWNANTEGDLSGYNLYRSASHQGLFEKVNVGLIAAPSYSDTGRTNHTSYYYFVTAVDSGGNESYPSKIETGHCASTTYQDYDAVIKAVQTILRDDSSLSGIADRNIYYENPPVIPDFPCVTIELLSEGEKWATNLQKDITYVIMVRAFVKYIQFATGKEEAKDLAVKINDVFQNNTKLGGLAYDSQVTGKNFVPATWGSIPVFAAELTLTAVQRVIP